MSVLVVGMGVTGEAVARWLATQGESVTAVEDHPSDASRARGAAAGVRVVEAPAPDELERLVRDASTVIPSPGVPVGHPVFALAEAEGVPVVSEVELAAERARVPIVAITGTNGKTTVTTLVTNMLQESGVDALAAGNIGRPFIEAAATDAAVLVVEVSSFQLQFTQRFRPAAAVWLNLSEDHLDWHPTMAHYAAAKARIWANQRTGDVAIVNGDDAAVSAAAAGVPPGVRVVTFGTAGDWSARDGRLLGPAGQDLGLVSDLPRRLPHDISNALAAAAAADAVGATPDGSRAALLGFRGLPHRVELIGEAGGVRFYDDSKATTPASVLAALSGLDSVVLIAGGRNKSLDLTALANGADHIRAVVAIGEAADEVRAAFVGRRPVVGASSMEDAVAEARRLAKPGDAVLLSPGCASFDMYPNYGARGDHFATVVHDQLEVVP
jgi:UDP-N-acetylmuramoylalanine--D-glutamate ligase